MSCWGASLLREADGSVWIAAHSENGHAITDAKDRDGTLARVRRDRGPIESPRTSDGYFDKSFCWGVLIDFLARRYRFYPCSKDTTPLDHLDQAIRASGAWEGWDAGIAMGGREEFAALIPEVARIIEPYTVLDEPQQAMSPAPDEDWFVDWDPVRFVLKVRHSAYWIRLFEPLNTVTIIATSGRTLDFRLCPPDMHRLHPLLAWLRSGAEAVSALCSVPPHPPPTEGETVENTVVVDRPRSIIHYSPTALAPARLLDAVRSAWPGWRLQVFPTDQQIIAMPDGTPVFRPRLDVLPLEP
jgi:hypothetical protein